MLEELADKVDDTVINSLSANHAYLKTLYNTQIRKQASAPLAVQIPN